MNLQRLLVGLAASLLLAGQAHAAEKLQFGPPPSWVVQHKIDTKPADQNKNAAVETLLIDHQVRFAPGRKTTFSDIAIKIQTPQGLKAGNLSLPWNPDTDTLTVNKLVIHRGNKVIDVLKSGQRFTTMRREQNLDMAMLDGVLTANIQPADLQVGDILEIQTTETSHNPVLGKHVEDAIGPVNVPVDKFYLRIEWPKAMALRLAKTDDLPAWTMATEHGLKIASMTLSDIQPIVTPSDAPARYRVVRFIQASNFKSWSDLAALFEPMYRKASQIPAKGPLRDQVEKIRKASSDPATRAEAALALVQNQVRYLALAMGPGALVPASASDTWARRYGDCKAKTALLLGILHELGIKAEPVFVNALVGGVLPDRLPAIGLFNHVLVRATIGGKVYWLDGTRTGDTKLSLITTPDFKWGLPLAANTDKLVRMIPRPLDKPSDDYAIHIDASKGIRIPAPFSVEETMRGDSATATNNVLSNLQGAALNQALRQYWRGQFDFVDITSATYSFDPKARELHLKMTGTAKLQWQNGWYESDLTGVGFKANFQRDDGPHKNAPFVVPYPVYQQTVETIDLPPGFTSKSISSDTDVDKTVAERHFYRHATLTDNTYVVKRTYRTLAPQFPASQAASAQKELRALNNTNASIRIPANYTPTKQEIAKIVASKAADARTLVKEAGELLQAGKNEEALAKVNAAIGKAPKDAYGYLLRSEIEQILLRDKQALADVEEARRLDPQIPAVYYTEAQLLWSQGKAKKALKPVRKAIKLAPKSPQFYVLEANILRRLGKFKEAVKVADRLVAADPGSENALVSAAMIYGGLNHKKKAMATIDAALAIKPEAYVYINRANLRDRTDYAGRLADLDKALKLSPDNMYALNAKAYLLLQQKKYPAAKAAYDSAIKVSPDNAGLLNLRGIVLTKMDQKAAADKDFDAARKLATGAIALNNICYSKAYAGVALDRALRECNAALKKSPHYAACLDSRGFVYLRLGKLDKAIDDYDAALAISPKLPSSLFGRAIALAREGKTAEAKKSFAAALKQEKTIVSNFADSGVKVPPVLLAMAKSG